MSNVEFFEHWLAHAEPRECFHYHQGHLAVDRERPGGSAVAALARRVWQASEEGFVLLTQRKLGDSAFDYLATRSTELQG